MAADVIPNSVDWQEFHDSLLCKVTAVFSRSVTMHSRLALALGTVCSQRVISWLERALIPPLGGRCSELSSALRTFPLLQHDRKSFAIHTCSGVNCLVTCTTAFTSNAGRSYIRLSLAPRVRLVGARPPPPSSAASYTTIVPRKGNS